MLYAGALPKATVEAITKFFHFFHSKQRHQLPQGPPPAHGHSKDPLIYHFHKLAAANPTVGATYAPILANTTKSIHMVIQAVITRIHDALILRASTMQRVITALVQKRQRQLKKSRQTSHTTEDTNNNQTQHPQHQNPTTQTQHPQREDTTTLTNTMEQHDNT